MKEYDVIIFDLDGTLTNPERGLVASFEYAHKKMGIKYESREALKRFIGPPLYEEWQNVYGISAEESAEMLLIFREFFAVYGWWDNELYEGIPELLKSLRDKGKRIVLATSKPEHFAHKILKLFGIAQYFDFAGGAASDKTRDKKHEVLEYALRAVGSPDKSRCILIGDRKYDAEGAKTVGIDSMGVLWGHGPREEIEAAGFTLTAEKISDVMSLLP